MIRYFIYKHEKKYQFAYPLKRINGNIVEYYDKERHKWYKSDYKASDLLEIGEFEEVNELDVMLDLL